MRENNKIKVLMVVVPLIIAFFSVFVVSGIASSVEFHADSIAALDEKQTTVLELTAASTAASAAITLLPGDTATPIAEIAGLNIGSRPASRKKGQRIEDLRAIPWGFSWAQCRLMLTGWYGMGSAIEAYLETGAPGAPRSQRGRLAQLREMAQDWPAFRTLLSNMEMVLAKSDLAIAARYAQLVPQRALREKIFGMISAEHGRTLAMLKLLTRRELLADNPALQASLRERFAYIDPLNYLQVDLIRRHRAAQKSPAAEADERVQRAIHLTINGIAAGLRNSG